MPQTKEPVHSRALVTGASGGLGAAIARQLASRGVEVWLAARREDKLREEANLIEREGGRAHVLPLDLARADETHERLVRLDAETGGIDLVVANAAIAGLAAAAPIERVPWKEVKGLFEVNLVGNVATVMAFVPGMIARGKGHIVGISSLAADAPNPRTAAYGASKAGFSFFLDSAGIGLRARGIAVTVVHPGFIRTPAAEGVVDPMPFIVEPDEAARIVDRAILRRARKIRFPTAMAMVNAVPLFLPAFVSEPLLRRVTRERTSPT